MSAHIARNDYGHKEKIAVCFVHTEIKGAICNMCSAMKNNYLYSHWLPIIVYFSFSFVFHFIWEMMQAPLFYEFTVSFWQHLKRCLFATATGDMLFMATIYFTLAVAHYDIWWLSKKSSYQHPITWILPIIIGILLAIGFELWAVYTVQRWSYGAMPLIPIVHVGLAPILQMALIPLLSIALVRAILAKIH